MHEANVSLVRAGSIAPSDSYDVKTFYGCSMQISNDVCTADTNRWQLQRMAGSMSGHAEKQANHPLSDILALYTLQRQRRAPCCKWLQK